MTLFETVSSWFKPSASDTDVVTLRPCLAPPVVAKHRRPIWTVKLCYLFVDYMRDKDEYGYWTSAEIDFNLGYYCDLHNYAYPDFTEARSVIAGLGHYGVKHGRRRIKGPQFARIRATTTLDRPYVYRISREVPKKQPVILEDEFGTPLVPVRSPKDGQKSGRKPARRYGNRTGKVKLPGKPPVAAPAQMMEAA